MTPTNVPLVFQGVKPAASDGSPEGVRIILDPELLLSFQIIPHYFVNGDGAHIRGRAVLISSITYRDLQPIYLISCFVLFCVFFTYHFFS